jgi:hypothetical protein
MALVFSHYCVAAFSSANLSPLLGHDIESLDGNHAGFEYFRRHGVVTGRSLFAD